MSLWPKGVGVLSLEPPGSSPAWTPEDGLWPQGSKMWPALCLGLCCRRPEGWECVHTRACSQAHGGAHNCLLTLVAEAGHSDAEARGKGNSGPRVTSPACPQGASPASRVSGAPPWVGRSRPLHTGGQVVLGLPPGWGGEVADCGPGPLPVGALLGQSPQPPSPPGASPLLGLGWEHLPQSRPSAGHSTCGSLTGHSGLWGKAS